MRGLFEPLVPVFRNVALRCVKLAYQIFRLDRFVEIIDWLNEVQRLIHLVVISLLGVRSNKIFLKVLNGVKLCDFINRHLKGSTLLL